MSQKPDRSALGKRIMKALFPPLLAILCLTVVPRSYSMDEQPARQLLLTITSGWDDSAAVVRRYERTGGKWRMAGAGMAAVVGEKGLAWDPAAPERDTRRAPKREGDRRAPAGRFPLSGAMGFASDRPEGLSIPFRNIEPGVHCVDDPASPWYNRIVREDEIPGGSAGSWKSSERMWLETEVYPLLLVVEYNTRPPIPGNGSCIFMHIRRGAGRPTTGCTAVERGDLEDILKWLRPEARPELVQLPMEEYRRLWRKWELPSPEPARERNGKR